MPADHKYSLLAQLLLSDGTGSLETWMTINMEQCQTQKPTRVHEALKIAVSNETTPLSMLVDFIYAAEAAAGQYFLCIII